MGLERLVNAYSNHFVHGVKRGGGSSSPQKGSVVGMEGDNSTSEPGGVMEVTMLGFHV